MFFLVVFGVTAIPAIGQDGQPSSTKVYRLAKIIQGADFNGRAMKKIDRLPLPHPPGSASQVGDLPVKHGKFYIFKFQAAYRAPSSRGETAEFHDILMIKLGCGDEILDAYQYTLEWADTPSLDLNRLGTNGLILKAGFDVRELGLANVLTGTEAGEGGVIDYSPFLPEIKTP
ncbi:MAG: hypothetical protein ACYDH0_09340 [Candidatus Aminicenantales bacterium]